MKAKHTQNIEATIRAIRAEIAELPKGKRHTVENLLNQITSRTKRLSRAARTQFASERVTLADYPDQQNRDREISRKAIRAALESGRVLTMFDCEEFGCSQMCNQVLWIRREIEANNEPWEVIREWTTFGTKGKRCKRYSMKRKEA